jgi:mRNA interferase RelE/StbE
MYVTKLTENATKDFLKLDKPIREQVTKQLRKIEAVENPHDLGKGLTGNLSGYWRYRVGDYRIVTKIQDEVFTVLAIAIGKRETVYETASTRTS